MQIPSELMQALQLVHQSGGRPRLVGGCVRDWLLGIKAKDYDVEVGLLSFEQLHKLLSPLGATDVVGRSFGVIKLRLGACEYDFSLPRRESKTGAGHRGFAVLPDPALSDAESAARRDFTINSIAYDPFAEQIIDPFAGARDLRARILRHTSNAFVEDPLRVLRAVQLAGRFDLSLAPETATLCASICDAYRELPKERIWAEWDKWATQSTIPSRGLVILQETGWLQHFPEIASLRGTPQEPEWHPEGDVFLHTQCCLDALVQSGHWLAAPPEARRLWSLAVLSHDFGKPSTTNFAERHGQLRWISNGHEAAGGPYVETFLQRIGTPFDLIEPVRTLTVNHQLHHQGPQSLYSDAQLRRLARRLIPATIEDLCVVMEADARGRPPISPNPSLTIIETLRKRARELQIEQQAPKPILLGRHLLSLGYAPGPTLKPILAAAFEAQLDGAFADEEGAMAWLKQWQVENQSANHEP